MKYLKLFVFISFLFLAPNLFSQTVDEVVNNYLNAIGGKEKLSQLKTIKLTGSLNVQGTDIGIIVSVVSGVGSRVDIEVPGMDAGYKIITLTKGWNYLPFQGQTSPVEMGEDEFKLGQAGLDLQTPLMNYNEKGHKLELLGKETVNGTECYKLKFTHKNGSESFWYIDTKNYYRIKTSARTKANGQDTNVETTYSDFRKTPEGYTFAFSQTNASGTINYTSIEVNKPVDTKIFSVQ